MSKIFLPAILLILLMQICYGLEVTDKFGDISVQKKGQDIWLPVEENAMIESGDLIRVFPGADLNLVGNDMSIKIGGESKFSLLDTGDGNFFNIFKGNYAVNNPSGEKIDLNTGDLLLSFRDANVLFSYGSAGDVTAVVKDGQALLYHDSSEEPIEIREGKKVSLIDGNLGITSLSDEDTRRLGANLGVAEAQPENTDTPADYSSGSSGSSYTPSGSTNTGSSSSSDNSDSWIPGLNVSGNVGSQSFDDKIYSKISLNPDFSVGKFGIGMDLSFHFDEKGKLREEDWDSFEDIVEKINYVRYGQKGDPFHLRAGALDVTLGNGFVVKGYSNTNRVPQEKKIGVYTGFEINKSGLDAFTPDVLSPKVIGTRIYNRQITLIRPLELGFTIAADIEPSSEIDRDSLKDESTVIWGFDAQYLIFSSDYLGLTVYSDFAKIQDYGHGFIFPGARFNFFILNISAEYRYLSDEFQPSFFDSFYEEERAVLMADSTVAYKTQQLNDIEKSSGFYTELSMDVFSILTVNGYYENSNSASGRVNSMSARARIIDGIIPKLTNLSASYTQRNVKKLFEFRTPTTNIEITGGYKISDNASLVLKFSEHYEDKDNNGRINGAEEVITNWGIQTRFNF